MRMVEEEADESMYWLEMLQDSGTVDASRVRSLLREADELVSIVVSSVKTKRANKAN